MKGRALTALVTGVVLLVPAAALMGATQRVPTGAYVRKPVSSVDELSAHINKDPVVRNRFAKHFGVAPAQLDEYIRDNVVITRVSKSTPRHVYICTRKGQLLPQKKVLKPGTAIFALKDTGEPLLVQSCGNPVIKQLPERVKVLSEAPQMFQVMRANETLPPPVVAVVPPVVASPPPAPIVPPALPPAAVPPVAAVPPAAIARGGPALWPLIPLIPFIDNHGGGGGGGNDGGGGGGGGGNDGGGGGGGDNPPPIPEPGGAAAVIATSLLPAAGLGIRRLRAGRVRGVISNQ